MCSHSLIHLLDLGEVTEEVMGGLVNCQLPSGLSPGLEGKWWGNNSTSLFPELTLKELVFLHHKYYSIFLLQ
jgi:hypothetical protein